MVSFLEMVQVHMASGLWVAGLFRLCQWRGASDFLGMAMASLTTSIEMEARRADLLCVYNVGLGVPRGRIIFWVYIYMLDQRI